MYLVQVILAEWGDLDEDPVFCAVNFTRDRDIRPNFDVDDQIRCTICSNYRKKRDFGEIYCIFCR